MPSHDSGMCGSLFEAETCTSGSTPAFGNSLHGHLHTVGVLTGKQRPLLWLFKLISAPRVFFPLAAGNSGKNLWLLSMLLCSHTNTHNLCKRYTKCYTLNMLLNMKKLHSGGLVKVYSITDWSPSCHISWVTFERITAAVLLLSLVCYTQINGMVWWKITLVC